MAEKSRNIYISETIRDIIEIPTENMGLTTPKSSKKCPQVIVTATLYLVPNRPNGRGNRKYLYLRNYDKQRQNSKNKFHHDELSKRVNK